MIGKLRKNEKGFGAIEGILIVVIIVLVGVGWMVYRNQKKSAPAVTTSTVTQKSTTTTTPAKPIVDPTVNWTAYSDTSGKFALRYPTTWVTATHPELCSPGILLLGPTSATVGKCASEGFGQVYILSSDGDSRTNRELGAGYVNIEKSDVTVAGIVGKKESGTAKGQVNPNNPGLGALDGGTIVVIYTFYTNGKTYVAEYDQAPGAPDALSDFNLLVAKTLTFSK